MIYSKHSLYKPKTLIKLFYLWGIYLIKNTLRGKRYIALTPPFIKNQIFCDRYCRKMHKVQIRDGVDWIQCERIFLCEEYDLSKTQRLFEIYSHYKKLEKSGSRPLVVDCGANIGLASHYFATTFPEARVVAVEPDPQNFSVAEFNCRELDVSFYWAAISSEVGSGTLIDMGSSNAFRVARDDAGDLSFLTIDNILAKNKDCIPFIIKIDIEGFEKDLFSANTGWIDKFPVLIIELHDWMLPKTNTSQDFLREIGTKNRDFMHYDGYVVSISNDI